MIFSEFVYLLPRKSVPGFTIKEPATQFILYGGIYCKSSIVTEVFPRKIHISSLKSVEILTVKYYNIVQSRRKRRRNLQLFTHIWCFL